MKRALKKALAIGATGLMLLSSTSAFAQPGYYIGNKKFLSTDVANSESLLLTLNNMIGNLHDLNGLVLDLDEQGTADYGAFRAANPNGGLPEFTAFAQSNPAVIPLDAKIVKADGSEIDDPDVGPVAVPEVVGISAVTETTLTVLFDIAPESVPAASSFQVSGNSVTNVAQGANSRTFILTLRNSLAGRSGTITVNGVSQSYNFTPNAKPEVSKIEFINYRLLRVTFNTIVDEISAADPANYYFEIVDGNARYGVASAPTLGPSNQLSKIETTYPGGAAAYWAAGNIRADSSEGYTVVDICLPEDARFTTQIDQKLNGDDIDDERTLKVEMRTSSNAPDELNREKFLIKDTLVNVAVRNVRDLHGTASLDTSVKPVIILDETKPELLGVYKIPQDFNGEYRESGYGVAAIGPYTLIRQNQEKGQTGEQLAFEYTEPVFDAHDLDKSDTEELRNVKLFVNGKEVDNSFMSFSMDSQSDYDEARIMKIDVQRAIENTPGEVFETNKYYRIQFKGVTDLAGNIEVASEHTFNVKFVDRPVVPPVIVKPVVEEVVQVADNMFRVEFNRDGVSGTLVIENADGEGGILEAPIPESVEGISYVAVRAMDHELYDPVLDVNITRNCTLAYDGADYINRVVKVKDVVVNNDNVAQAPLLGDDYTQGNMRLYNDIQAPAAEAAQSVNWNNRAPVINIPVDDVTPWSDENIDYRVKGLKYSYSDQRFGNEIDFANGDYLPVKVSYQDAGGATHSAIVTNQDVRPYTGIGVDPDYLNPGFTGSIEFTEQSGSDILTLDLSNYPELLDGNGKLVAGVQYKVEIPRGYFSDSPRDILLTGAGFMPHTWSTDYNFSYGGNDYDLLYVDDARTPQLASLLEWSEVGYTSAQQVVSVSIGTKPADPAPLDYVPQTSKELIRYDEPTDSIWVEFTGTINPATLKDRSNYTINGKTLKQWDDLLGTTTEIKYELRGDRKFAAFRMPLDSIEQDGDVAFKVMGVANPAGGTMTPVETVIRLHDNYRPIIIDADVASPNQIKLTFNEPLMYLADPVVKADEYSAAKNFKVMVNNAQVSVESAVLPEVFNPSSREVTLNLKGDIPGGASVTIQVVPDQNGNILLVDCSTNKNPLNVNPIFVVQ